MLFLNVDGGFGISFQSIDNYSILSALFIQPNTEFQLYVFKIPYAVCIHIIMWHILYTNDNYISKYLTDLSLIISLSGKQIPYFNGDRLNKFISEFKGSLH